MGRRCRRGAGLIPDVYTACGCYFHAGQHKRPSRSEPSNLADMTGGHQCIVDGKRLDGDYQDCVDGNLWGMCDDSQCTGVCTDQGRCPCSCHQFEQGQAKPVNSSYRLVCPLCQIAVDMLSPLIRPASTGGDGLLGPASAWHLPPSIAGWMLDPCGDLLLTSDKWRLWVTSVGDDLVTGDVEYRAAFRKESDPPLEQGELSFGISFG